MRYFKRICFTLTSLLLIALSGHPSDVKFYNINSIFGISMREVHVVCSDYNGFVWASSKTGILRMTDDDCRIYQLPYEEAGVVTVRMVYNDSTLLVYTSNGQLFFYNEILDRFESIFNIKKQLGSTFISTNSIIVDKNKSLWFGTSYGLYHYQNNQVLQIEEERANINLLKWLSDEEIILAKANHLFLYNTSTGKFSDIYTGDLITSSIQEMLMDTVKGILWIGTMAEGLFYYDFNIGKIERFNVASFPAEPIRALEYNYDSTLFVGIDGRGVWQLDISERKVLNIYKENLDDPGSLRGNGVYDIYVDHNNRVWVCTYSDGLSYFDQASPLVSHLTHQINNQNSLVNNCVNSVIQDYKGRL
ncbi:MAG: hybrid sensor histidine kinase/response regulator, partial [Prolixibacteraceae bacterium]|nr:hybrid sensor histidine kinase/response regulator [Prolixibacteraceae bacterium]